MTDIHALAAPFQTASAEDWRRLVADALGGAALDSLGSATREGIAFEPLYPQAREARPLFARPAEGAWAVLQRLDHPDPGEANSQARREVERGATGLALVPAGAPAAEGFGLEFNAGTLAKVLDDIDLTRIHLRVEPHEDGFTYARLLADHLADRGLAPGGWRASFGLDPIGIAAHRGGFANGWSVGEAPYADIDIIERGFRGPIFEADGRVYATAGADTVQELGAVLATAADYLRLLDELGSQPEQAFPSIGVTLTVDADQLVSIAKLRAARLLWARTQEVCGAPRTRLRLHAETARPMMMRADPHTNLLRTMVAAFAAGVGGADSLTVLPFTIALGLPDALARRLARNTQLLLMEESHLHRVADPAAGAGAIEALTGELSRRAWAAFQAIEREGGIAESLKEGRLQARVAAQREALVAACQRGETGGGEAADGGVAAQRESRALGPGAAGLVGVTHYIDRAPVPVKVAELSPRRTAPSQHIAVAFEPLEPLDLESRVSRVPEAAP